MSLSCPCSVFQLGGPAWQPGWAVALQLPATVLPASELRCTLSAMPCECDKGVFASRETLMPKVKGFYLQFKQPRYLR